MKGLGSLGGSVGPRTALLGAALGLGLSLGVRLVPVAAADGAAVTVANFAFTPQNIIVKAGTAVTWENDDDIPHLVVLADGSFRSKALDTNDKATFTFAKVGEMPYFCGLHPRMTGKVIVVP